MHTPKEYQALQSRSLKPGIILRRLLRCVRVFVILICLLFPASPIDRADIYSTRFSWRCPILVMLRRGQRSLVIEETPASISFLQRLEEETWLIVSRPITMLSAVIRLPYANHDRAQGWSTWPDHDLCPASVTSTYTEPDAKWVVCLTWLVGTVLPKWAVSVCGDTV